MLNDNDSRSREWDFKYLELLKLGIKISYSFKPERHLMSDGNIAYLYPPSTGVRGIMLEYEVGRKQAEEWWSIQ